MIVGFAVFWWRIRGHRPRERAYTRLLDAADALEARLRVARSEIETMTGGEDETVRTALQEMLRQRLGLQQHGATAPIRKLDEMREEFDSYVRELRRAKDQEEFDRFMRERRANGQGDVPGFPAT